MLNKPIKLQSTFFRAYIPVCNGMHCCSHDSLVPLHGSSHLYSHLSCASVIERLQKTNQTHTNTAHKIRSYIIYCLIVGLIVAAVVFSVSMWFDLLFHFFDLFFSCICSLLDFYLFSALSLLLFFLLNST